MGRVGMTQRVGGKLLFSLYLGTTFLNDPLDARCGKWPYRPVFGDLTVKNVLYGVFGPEIGSQTSGKVWAQGNIAVYLSFLLFTSTVCRSKSISACSRLHSS